MKHHQLADYLRGRCSVPDLHSLASHVADYLRSAWNLPISNTEIASQIEQWSRDHQTPPGSPLTLPARLPLEVGDRYQPETCGRCLSSAIEVHSDGRLHCLACGETWTVGQTQDL